MKIIKRKASAYSKNERTENFLRVVEFRNPEWIPCVVGTVPATWIKYKEKLEKIALRHPKLFSYYKKGDFKKMKLNRAYQKGRWKDVWGILSTS